MHPGKNSPDDVIEWGRTPRYFCRPPLFDKHGCIGIMLCSIDLQKYELSGTSFAFISSYPVIATTRPGAHPSHRARGTASNLDDKIQGEEAARGRNADHPVRTRAGSLSARDRGTHSPAPRARSCVVNRLSRSDSLGTPRRPSLKFRFRRTETPVTSGARPDTGMEGAASQRCRSELTTTGRSHADADRRDVGQRRMRSDDEPSPRPNSRPGHPGTPITANLSKGGDAKLRGYSGDCFR
jgi:hypothetical protein